MARILIIRFSALGDVAMTIPVIHSLAVQYPQHEITVLSRAVWQPLFQGLPANVGFVGADLTGKHKGLWGLNSLYSELKAMHFDYIADFHHVLRSKYLCLRFRLANKPVASICKGRAGKKKLVRRHDKVMENQKSSFRRYADVLEKLGLPVLLNFSSIYGEGKGNFAEIEPVTGPKEDQKWIGIAPFAKHAGKIYPLELQEQVIAHFAANPKVKVFLFGGGKSEQDVFDAWIAKYPSVVSMIGKLNMRTELNLMSHLDVCFQWILPICIWRPWSIFRLFLFGGPLILMLVLWAGSNCRLIPCNLICHAVPALYMDRSLAGGATMLA